MPKPPRSRRGPEGGSSSGTDVHLNCFSSNLGGNRETVFHQGLTVVFDGLFNVGHRFPFVRPLRNSALEGWAVCNVPGLTAIFDYHRILHSDFLWLEGSWLGIEGPNLGFLSQSQVSYR